MRVFAVLNPGSGNSQNDEVRACLQAHLGADDTLECHELSGDEDLQEVVRAALGRGAERVVAAGGDGTVSAVATALCASGGDLPLLVVPVGTWNLVAKELGLPLDAAGACALIRDGGTRTIDTMRVDGRVCLCHVSLGVHTRAFQDVTAEDKRRLGRLASLLRLLQELRRRPVFRFKLAVDGRWRRVRAAAVVVANVGAMSSAGMRWGPSIRVDDGLLDVCVVGGSGVWDYVRTAWRAARHRHRDEPRLRYLRARRSVEIRPVGQVPVRADGEDLGARPVRVELCPRSLKLVVPGSEDAGG